MLQDIRDRATGPIAWFIVALLIIPFALWGVNSYFQGGSAQSNDVAKVGDQTISNIELQRAYNKRYRQLQQRLGKRFDPDMIKPEAFRQQVLQSLVQRSLLTQYAHDQGYRVTDAEVLSYLQSIPAFQKDGTFSSQLYRQVLKRQRMAPAAFEAQIRSALLIQQVRDGLVSTAVVTPAEVNRAYRSQNQSRSLSYLVYPAGHYLDAVNVSQAEIKTYYQSHQSDFATPEKVKLAYIDLDKDKLKPDEPADQSALKVIYQAQKSRFTKPAERKARHILIKVDDKTPSEAAKAKAEMIRKKIEDGAEFASMAKEYSQDAGSREQGGQLGWIGPDALSKPFEHALFSLKKGAVSQPVRTKYGWHLIKAEAVKPAHTKPFDDPGVQAQLKSEYQQRAVGKRFEKMADKLDRISFEKPDSLQPAAKKLGLKIQHTDWITRNGQHSGIASNPEVIKAAFSGQVFNQNVNSKSLDISDNRKIVVRVAEKQQARTKPLEEVKAQIEEKLKHEQAADQARSAAEKALSSVKSGKSLKALAASESYTSYRDPGFVKRDQSDANQVLLSRAFSMAHPQSEGDASYAVVGLANGDYAVLSLQGIRYGHPAKASASERKKLRQKLARQQAGSELAAYMDSIREQVKVKILNKDNKERPAAG